MYADHIFDFVAMAGEMLFVCPLKESYRNIYIDSIFPCVHSRDVIGLFTLSFVFFYYLYFQIVMIFLLWERERRMICFAASVFAH